MGRARILFMSRARLFAALCCHLALARTLFLTLPATGAAALRRAAAIHPPTRRVTFSAPAMTADRLLQALSARAGVRLECAPETRGEVLLLHVRGAPLP